MQILIFKGMQYGWTMFCWLAKLYTYIEDMSTPKSSELTTLPQGIYTISLSHQFCFKSWFFLLHRLVAGFRANRIVHNSDRGRIRTAPKIVTADILKYFQTKKQVIVTAPNILTVCRYQMLKKKSLFLIIFTLILHYYTLSSSKAKISIFLK